MKVHFFMSLWAHLLNNHDNISQSQHNKSQSCSPIQKLLLDIYCIYFWWTENIALLTWGKFYKQKKKTKINFAHKENLHQNMILQIVQLMIFVSYRHCLLLDRWAATLGMWFTIKHKWFTLIWLLTWDSACSNFSERSAIWWLV